MSRGHVFVVHSDLTALACDDVVVPTDHFLHMSPYWHGLVSTDLTLDDLGIERETWTEQRHARADDGIWLVDTGGTASSDVEWFVDGIRRVLRAIARSRQDSVPARRRARHLVALPLVGVGAGGASARRGEMIRELLGALGEHAYAGHDVALVLSNARDHGAVQHVRRGRVRHDLDETQLASARRLAQHARDGELALFLGAGVSASAGLPTWGALLDQLAERTTLTSEERSGLGKLPPQDAASLIEMSLTGSLDDVLADVLATARHGLSHALLAALPTREAVTTNYDGLLEQAWRAVGHDPAVLPFDPPTSRQPWVLKLHGDLERKTGVVLTRGHYLEFDGQRGALAGVVQGLLMTRHVLFAGFGMADENFLKLAHGVRQVREDERPLGTALSLLEDPLRRRLGKDQFVYQSFGPADGETAEAARRLEIFLDLVAHEAVDDTPFLLDQRYRALLTEDEAALARALDELPARAGSSHPAARRVRELLDALGRELE